MIFPRHVRRGLLWMAVALASTFPLTLAHAARHRQPRKSGQKISASSRPAAHSARKQAKNSVRSRKGLRSSKARTYRGQQRIDSERAQAIQQALIREHYLDGQPSGTWDSATEQALMKYQAAHGWQTKVVPDARALIKLGLGPNHQHLLNPETAMTTSPATLPGAPVEPQGRGGPADSAATPNQ